MQTDHSSVDFALDLFCSRVNWPIGELRNGRIIELTGLDFRRNVEAAIIVVLRNALLDLEFTGKSKWEEIIRVEGCLPITVLNDELELKTRHKEL